MQKKQKTKKDYLIFILQLAAAAVLVIIDRFLKNAAAAHLKDGGDVILIKNLIYLTYAENTGAAFSAFSNSTLLLSIVTLAALVAGILFLFFAKIESKLLNVAAAMILGGGAGNLTDRLMNGYVVDYIGTLFMNFPIYNFADILITVGVAIICARLIYDIIKDEKRKKLSGGENGDGNS